MCPELAGETLLDDLSGLQREDDTLPPRVLQETLPNGVAEGVGLTKSDLDMMIGGYYRARGWTEDGLIPDDKIEELGPADFVRTPAPVA